MQLALFPAPPAPLQLALELPTFSTTTSTPKGPTMTTSTPQRRRGPLRRLLARLTTPRGRIRPFYTAEPFNVATLARRACLSESAVRRALLRDELQGLVGRVLTPGRAVLWQGRRR